MVDYPTIEQDSDESLRAFDCGELFCFSIRTEKGFEDPRIAMVDLSRDAIAALVGQLSSWLERTKDK